MNAVPLDQLPHLCMKKILEFLSLRDLVKCRAVSRRFKFYANEAAAELDELVVTVYGEKPDHVARRYCDYSYLTGKRIDFRHLISWKAFSSVRSSPLNLDQLKFLYIHLETADLNCDLLNAFKQLVQLKLKLRPERSDAVPKTLNLPNLQGLDVCDTGMVSFVLETPKLEHLACLDIERIQAEHPDTIKHLKCDFYEGGPTTIRQMTQFNPNILEVSFFNREPPLFPIRLSDWENLKELHLETMFSFRGEDDYHDLKDWLVNIIRQKADLKRDDLKVYLEEVSLLNANQLPAYEIMMGDEPMDEDNFDVSDQYIKARYYFWMKNYRLLRRDSYPDVRAVDFNVLLKLDFELSADFFQRFPRIKELTAAGLVHQDDFEWFLKSATAVRRLNLSNTSLDQSFMDRLPGINGQLTHLEVNEMLVTNFDFILQFERLKEFKTDRQLGSLDLAARAFQQLRKFTFFQFRADNESVQIEIIEDDYELWFTTIKNSRATFGDRNLNWAQLTALYEQRTIGLEKRMRIA